MIHLQVLVVLQKSSKIFCKRKGSMSANAWKSWLGNAGQSIIKTQRTFIEGQVLLLSLLKMIFKWSNRLWWRKWRLYNSDMSTIMYGKRIMSYIIRWNTWNSYIPLLNYMSKMKQVNLETLPMKSKFIHVPPLNLFAR